MSDRVCVFVDGENFRHSITDLFEQFNRADYLPETDWALLFNWLAEKASPGCTRKRTYWYVIEHIDFFPYKFPDPEKNTDKLRGLLNKCPQLAESFEGLTGRALVARLKEAVRDLRAKRDAMKGRFEGWKRIQDGIALRNPAVTFKRAGAIRYDLFQEQIGSEKAVDVKLACDLVLLKDIYEVAVIVTGDQDYVPAVEVVKDFGKSVCSVAFKTRGGRLLPGGARRLSIATDRCLEIPYGEFAHYLGFKDA